MRLFKLFRRLTSSGVYLKEIDLIRFFAIGGVVLSHIVIFLLKKDPKCSFSETSFLTNLSLGGSNGVQVFFTLSGIVITLILLNNKKDTDDLFLENYYKRRLTRIEPPYLILIFLIFFIFLIKKNSVHAYKSLLYSIFYITNFFTKENYRLNSVSWSLEIEIQFYLVAPLVVYTLFKIKSFITRRAIICISILLSIIFNSLYILPNESLLNYFHYFLSGIFLADLFKNSQSLIRDRSNNFIFTTLTFLLLLGVASYPHKFNPNISIYMKLIFTLLFVLCINLMIYLILFLKTLSNIFITSLSLIGGMCYSIYLIHYPIISILGNYLINHNLKISYFILFPLFLLTILLLSSLFYLLIEKPMMSRNWFTKKSLKSYLNSD